MEYYEGRFEAQSNMHKEKTFYVTEMKKGTKWQLWTLEIYASWICKMQLHSNLSLTITLPGPSAGVSGSLAIIDTIVVTVA